MTTLSDAARAETIAPRTEEGAAREDTPGPPVPEEITDTGLSEPEITDLLLKTLYVHGAREGHRLAEIVALPYRLLDGLLLRCQQRRLVEVLGTRGHGRSGYTFSLTSAGSERARAAMEASQYVGPAPVPLDDLRRWIRSQSASSVRVGPRQLEEMFHDLVLPPEVLRTLGPAVNSGASLFLHGAPGNGKTAIAERIGRFDADPIYLPYAVEVDGQVMIVFDPVHHRLVDDEDSEDENPILRNGAGYDRRYVLVERPSVMVGGELTLDQLDLQYDPDAKVYQAPFQLKAAGGTLIIDDFGRQRMRPEELLNRWIVPLEKQIDFLSLHTGVKFPVPFDCLLIFATNLDPTDLVDEAFLRRIQFKIRIDSPTRENLTTIFREVCREREIEFDPSVVEHLYTSYYERMEIAPRGCHPRDIVKHVECIAAYEGRAPALTRELVDRAVDAYFLIMEHQAFDIDDQGALT